MAIAFGSVGTKCVSGTTSMAILYPGSIVAGDLLVCFRVIWPTTATASDIPGWDMRVDGVSGTGNPGAVDSHVTRIRIDTKVADGTEIGGLATTQGGTISGTCGIIARYTKESNKNWDIDGSGTPAGDTSHAANRATGDSGTVDIASGDFLIAGIAVDTDAALTPTGLIINHTSSAAGVGTVSRRTSGLGAGTGTDGNVDVADAPYTGTTKSGGMAFAWTTATAQCGPVGFVRLREIDPLSADFSGWGVAI